MNGGKPIKESRDVDVPLAVAHFFYHAGWADKLEYALPGRKARPIGVCGQIIPWNFPLLMAAWKIAPALACGNTVVLKPAETTPLTALAPRDDLPGGGPPAGRREHHHGRGRDGRAPRQPPARAEDRLHRLDGGRQADPEARRRDGQAAHARARRQGREHRLRGRAARPGRRGDRQRHLLQPGARLLRGLAAARRRSPSHDVLVRKLALRIGRCASATRSTRTRTSARSTRRCSSRRSASSSQSGVDEGAVLHQSACALPAKGFWFPPTLLHGRRAVLTGSRARRSSGRSSPCMTFRTPDEAVEKANNTPYGLSAGVWTDKGSKIFKISQRSCAPASSGRTRSTSSTRPRRSAATRSPASAARADATASRRTSRPNSRHRPQGGDAATTPMFAIVSPFFIEGTAQT